MFSGTSARAQAWPQDISPKPAARAAEAWRLMKVIGVRTGVSGTRFPQPEPWPLPPSLPPRQLPIRLTSLQFAAFLQPTHVLQGHRHTSPQVWKL